jgi:hypothetical protein
VTKKDREGEASDVVIGHPDDPDPYDDSDEPFCWQALFLRRREGPCPSAFGVIHFPRHRFVSCHEDNETAWLEGVINDPAHNRAISINVIGWRRRTRRNKVTQKPVVPRLRRSRGYPVQLEAHHSFGIYIGPIANWAIDRAERRETPTRNIGSLTIGKKVCEENWRVSQLGNT